MNILVLNAGSSSLKFQLLRVDDPANDDPAVLVSGSVDRWGTPQAQLHLQTTGKPAQQTSVAAESPADAARHAIESCIPFGIDATGHRVVHGGRKFLGPTRIDAAVIRAVHELSTLAPLHNDSAIAGMEAALNRLPQTPAVAVFDTSFHQSIPEFAANYALPLEWARQNGLHRYGFHGISHQFIARRLRFPRIISCHLGNGCSICAIRDEKSVDTSMGFTPLDGLIMGTRSGDIDPGLLLHLITQLKMTAPDVSELLNRRSGLLGISGQSADVRDLLQRSSNGDARCSLALEMFCYRIRKYIGAYLAVLGGAEALAFTGGIGQHAWQIRRDVCAGLSNLGVVLDESQNQSASQFQPIHAKHSAVHVWVIPAGEEKLIAQETFRLLLKPPGAATA